MRQKTAKLLKQGPGTSAKKRKMSSNSRPQSIMTAPVSTRGDPARHFQSRDASDGEQPRLNMSLSASQIDGIESMLGEEREEVKQQIQEIQMTALTD